LPHAIAELFQINLLSIFLWFFRVCLKIDFSLKLILMQKLEFAMCRKRSVRATTLYSVTVGDNASVTVDKCLLLLSMLFLRKLLKVMYILAE